jgi:5'-methylthioadenosine/S-adenosylhomocysteine nucleosidase
VKSLGCVLLYLMWAVARSAEAPPVPTHYTAADTILILGAVPQEITVFREGMGNPAPSELWGIPYYRGRLSGKNVIVAITGIGKTFTAMTTTLLVTELKPRMVVMSGTGARINPQLRTGDIIVATTTHEHDYGSLTRQGMVYRSMNGPIGGNEVDNDFSPPGRWLKIADQAISTYEAPEVTANGSTYRVAVRRGVVASSDLFGVTEERIELLRTLYHTDLMEMESAPLGHVCQSLGVPYLIVRAGSNLAQEAPNDDYLRLGPIAAREAARFTVHLLEYL